MAYCTVANIENLLQRTFDLTTRPTSTQVEVIIENWNSAIDSILKGLGFTVPIAVTSVSYEMLRKCCMHATASDVLGSWARSEDDETGLERFYYDKFQDCISMIKDNPSMIDASISSSAVPTPKGSERDPKFTMDTVW